MTDKHFMQAKTEEVVKKKKPETNETETAQFDQGPTSEAVQRALANPTSSNLTPAVMTSLQRSHGNQFVAQLARKHTGSKLSAPIQMKMSVTAANDQHEQEADSVAQNVINKISSGDVQRDDDDAIQTQRLDRQEEEELAMKRIDRQEEDEEMMMPKRIDRQEEDELAMKRIDRQEEEEMMMKRIDRQEEEELAMKRIDRADDNEEEDNNENMMMKRIDRKSSADGFDVNGDIEDRIENSRGSGQSLDDNTRDNMENAFGADFSNVRVHADSEAADLSNSVQARAFTTGSDIYFNEGEYNPGSSQGQELLAHELTHTVQQGAVTQAKRKDKGED